MPAREFDRIADRLVVIHKRLTPQQVLEAFRSDYDGNDVDDEEDQVLNKVKAWCSTESTISAFRRLIQEKGTETHWNLICELKKPLIAEIWERVDGDDSENEFDDDDEN